MVPGLEGKFLNVHWKLYGTQMLEITAKASVVGKGYSPTTTPNPNIGVVESTVLDRNRAVNGGAPGRNVDATSDVAGALLDGKETKDP